MPRVIPDADGRALLPSVVAFDARRACSSATRPGASSSGSPSATVYSVKRLMGRGYEDVKDELRYFPFQVAAERRES